MAQIQATIHHALQTTITHANGAQLTANGAHENHDQFAPPDLLLAALASCMVSMLSFRAQQKLNLDLAGTTITIDRTFQREPLRIATLTITIQVTSPRPLSKEERFILQSAAETCPVLASLHPKIAVKKTYIWNEQTAPQMT